MGVFARSNAKPTKTESKCKSDQLISKYHRNNKKDCVEFYPTYARIGVPRIWTQRLCAFDLMILMFTFSKFDPIGQTIFWDQTACSFPFDKTKMSPCDESYLSLWTFLDYIKLFGMILYSLWLWLCYSSFLDIPFHTHAGRMVFCSNCLLPFPYYSNLFWRKKW